MIIYGNGYNEANIPTVANTIAIAIAIYVDKVQKPLTILINK